MSTEITMVKTPEEEELARKRADLTRLESQLAERELDLATLRGVLRAFEARYLRIVGVRYAQLDKIEAETAEYMATLKPKDREAQEHAQQARAQARESAEATEAAETPDQVAEFRPSENLKKLYREIARKLHPDLTTDPEEKARRHRIMAEASNAYESGDEGRLRQILAEWETSPEAVKGEGPGAELVRVIRKIAQLVRRLQAIAAQISELVDSELNQMKTKVDEAATEGRDLLTEMAENLDRQIADARQRLTELNDTTAH